MYEAVYAGTMSGGWVNLFMALIQRHIAVTKHCLFGLARPISCRPFRRLYDALWRGQDELDVLHQPGEVRSQK